MENLKTEIFQETWKHHPYYEAVVSEDGKRICSLVRQGESAKSDTKSNCLLITASPVILKELIEARDLVQTLMEEGSIAKESIRVQEFLDSSQLAISKALGK